ncbi:MAG: S8 family serine peptidase [Candidatus Sericytochromatia bacterium]|nr:S8 family serine peptidase [Candidatus Sericytochromatia bacterium]
MRQARLVSGLILAALVAAGCGRQAPAAPQTRGAGLVAGLAVSGQRAVVMLRGEALPGVLAAPNRAGLTVVDRLPELRALVVQASNGAGRQALLALAADPGVASVTPDWPVSLEAISNDPMVGQQYSLRAGNVAEAWSRAPKRGKGVLVALIDSGIDLGHPEFEGRVNKTGVNVIDPLKFPQDDHGHGTHCAGIIGATADNGEGIAGVAPGVQFLPVKIFNSRGQGTASGVSKGIVNAMTYQPKVMSMSIGLYQYSPVLEEALQYALDRDCVLVASAGNSNKENDPQYAPHLPSTYPGVIEVASSNSDNVRSKYSNFGKTVSVIAPGETILSTWPRAGLGPTAPKSYTTASGTSMAAPFVAGVAALIRGENPGLKRDEVRRRIEAGARDLGDAGFDPYHGHGLIDAGKALSLN